MKCEFRGGVFGGVEALDDHRWRSHRQQRLALEALAGGQADLALVAPEEACPRCGERRRARLDGSADPTQMHCKACDQSYLLPGIGEAPETVEEAMACPRCGEQRLDWLLFKETEDVECGTCGEVYRL